MPHDPVRYKLTVAYDGTDFVGWQKQEPIDPATGERTSLRSVAHVVEQAVRKVLREPVNVKGASRTDSGVHAWGQVAAFTSTPDPERGVGWPADRGCDKLLRALNSELPGDVLVRSVEPVPLAFDPVVGAVRKEYSYDFHVGQSRPLWDRRYVWFTYYDLDLERMRRAAAHLIGTHDFNALAQISHGRKTTVRTIFSCDVSRAAPVSDRCGRQPPEAHERADDLRHDRSETGPAAGPAQRAELADGERLRLTVCGSGFLYNMVRIIAGTLMEAGRGRIDPDSIPDILASRDRRRAGPTLPPQGLCLQWIEYA